ncbi:MAG: DUF695 domain-containing protein [Phaeodactylibacter sp.]|nr:DUF695 domain-containing protein [Phaeodactylibacter sp.]MCB9299313.1 DUF695 domain-containing protein [Lewinellaceae bacterium]HQV33655.1 DUF695 domain-containing protein [Calditrichia bacterium]
MKLYLLLFGSTFFLFACQNSQEEDHPLPEHKEDWAVFAQDDATAPRIVTVDLGWQEALPVEAFSQSLVIRVKAQEVLANGFPVGREVNLADGLQDELIRALEKPGLGIFTGSRTGAKEKALVFYLRPLPAAERLARKIVQDFTARPVEVHLKQDPSWQNYREELIPNGQEMNEIQNERILHRLQESGDQLLAPRPVGHWAYFPDAARRQQFLDTLLSAGFEIVALDTLKEGSKQPFGAHVERVDSVHVPYVHHLTWGMAELARRHGGAYDGWETILVRD